MEVNKDEADRCIELAEKFLLECKNDKAEKFLLKAERLYPTQKAKDLLARLAALPEADEGPRKRSHTNSPPTPKRENKDSKEDGLKEKKESKEGDSSSISAEYSEEQLEAVSRIKKCKDYYEILGVSKDVPDSEIKKAYKKLALQLHPDKNKCPGAVESFKAIGNAVAVLTDPEKRKLYDLHGSEEERMSARRRNHENQEYNYTRGFEADFTAEELFNMFFGGGFSNQTVYTRRNGRWQRTSQEYHQSHQQQQQQQQQQQTGGYTVFLQMMPILILIVLSMMSSLFISDPIYSLHVSSKFPVQRKTLNLRVPYYVKENFHSEYQGSLRRLEITVEEEYINNLRHACYREKNYRETMLWKARNFGDRDMFQKAHAIRTPSCDILNDLQGRA